MTCRKGELELGSQHSALSSQRLNLAPINRGYRHDWAAHEFTGEYLQVADSDGL